MHKYILIPDSFKGTLSARDFCAVAREAIGRADPGAQVLSIPLADGGEGTVEAFLAACGGQRIECPCTGPYGGTAPGFYGLLPDGTAVVELAAAAGLPLAGTDLHPAEATPYGVGQLLLHAARHGARRLLLGLGGSATNDGYGENDRVRYIRNETNKGASASRNRGVQLAKGDYIAFLDADDYWDPEKLEKQEKALAKTGDVLCCTGRELIYDQEPEKQKIFSVPERITYKMLLRGNVIGCSSVLAKRSVLLEFPMEKDECHEDYLDWLRILKKYGTACGVDEPLLKYRLSSTGKSGNKLHSAGMTYRVYRELGMGTFRSLYCFACYAVNGVRKYYGKGKKRGRD